MDKNKILEQAGDRLFAFLEKNQKRLRHIMGTDVIIDRLAMITDIYMPAMIQHQKVFPKYKGINKGKTVVITGTGPTFAGYQPMENVIHMGINDAIFRKDIRYDYYFLADFDDGPEYCERIFSTDYDFTKFFGIHYTRKGALIPAYLRERENVEVYYADSYNASLSGNRFENDRKFVYPLDLSVSPFKSYGTNLYCVFQFALWTHPEKIYLVGADCRGSVYQGGKVVYDYSRFIRPWRKLKEFAEANYPDIKIISLNPVGLKGIFKDEYTEK